MNWIIRVIQIVFAGMTTKKQNIAAITSKADISSKTTKKNWYDPLVIKVEAYEGAPFEPNGVQPNRFKL